MEARVARFIPKERLPDRSRGGRRGGPYRDERASWAAGMDGGRDQREEQIPAPKAGEGMTIFG